MLSKKKFSQINPKISIQPQAAVNNWLSDDVIAENFCGNSLYKIISYFINAWIIHKGCGDI